jgi:hypothetical protein
MGEGSWCGAVIFGSRPALAGTDVSHSFKSRHVHTPLRLHYIKFEVLQIVSGDSNVLSVGVCTIHLTLSRYGRNIDGGWFSRGV